jgi:hypothetical protein
MFPGLKNSISLSLTSCSQFISTTTIPLGQSATKKKKGAICTALLEEKKRDKSYGLDRSHGVYYYL